MTLSRFLRFAGLVLALTLLPLIGSVAVAQDATPGASPTAAQSVEITGLVDHPISVSVDDIKALPSQTVDVTFQSGKGEQQHTYTGALLSDVLALASPTLDPDIKNQVLQRYLVITASDGYTVVLSMGEIDPAFGNNPYLLAWEEDGAPLSAEDGPVRLVTPGDIKGGRYVTGVIRIEVRGLESESAS